jgi:hypothetical protein
MSTGSEYAIPHLLISFTEDNNEYSPLKPKKVIFNEKERMTICIWDDNSKTIVRATPDEKMTHEHGIAMAIIKKLYNNRGEFLRLVNSATIVNDIKKDEEHE